MRRIALISFGVCAVLLAGLALPYPAARTAAPARPDSTAKLDISKYTLGELLEGNGPSITRFAPGALRALSMSPMAPQHVSTAGIPAPSGMSADFKHYLSSVEIDKFLSELETRYPNLVQTHQIGTSSQKRPLMAIRITNELAPEPIDARPVMYIDAQHHARELISTEIALYTAWTLLDGYGQDPWITHLVDTRVLYVVPTVNPDGNQIALTDYQEIRKTANPIACDDDGDGKFDEDPSVGYGYGTDEVYQYDFDQAWADAHPTNPFGAGWEQHLVKDPQRIGRFTGIFGGERKPIPETDKDGDGRVDEDEIGGTDPNRNYDIKWVGGNTNCRDQTFRGPAALSEPESRAVRDFAQELPHLATGISYHSGTDLILHPWGWSTVANLPEVNAYELLGRKGSQLTEADGFRGSPHTWTARGLYVATGSTMDYLYDQMGVYAFSPEVYGGDGTTLIERQGTTASFRVGQSLGKAFNPDPDQILASTDRWNRWALYLLAATPNVELNAIGVKDDQLVIALGNDGLLPAAVTLTLEGSDGQPVGGAGNSKTLEATSQCWSFPLAGLKAHSNHVQVVVQQPVGTKPHEIEQANWQFSLDGDGHVVLERGVLRPFMDLSTRFDGGWFAEDKWDTNGMYHQPATQPISAMQPTILAPCDVSGLPAPLVPEVQKGSVLFLPRVSY